MINKGIRNKTVVLLFTISLIIPSVGQQPVRIGIAGLSHSHVIPLLRNLKRNDIRIVGVSENNSELLNRYARQYSIPENILFTSLDEMLDQTNPEGVITFTSIFDHLKIVQACAPRGIHVMVEKPLAVSTRHVAIMSELVRKSGILLLTNYETTWYPSNHYCYNLVKKGELGDLRKIIVYDGHKGPKEINVNEEFLEWLTDPALNGGGAVTDFGCYGADLITWLKNGEKPVSVYATLKQYKPLTYPKVDDDATIILSYPGTEGVIHASWNWPFNRKDMHVYGTTGYVFADNAETIRYKLDEKSPENMVKVPLSEIAFADPFAYFAAAIRKTIRVSPADLSSFEINRTVVEILEAARTSDRTGREVRLNKK